MVQNNKNLKLNLQSCFKILFTQPNGHFSFSFFFIKDDNGENLVHPLYMYFFST